MVNFRFHLVSLTAVFLALAIGIAMGATVVDQATVKLLRSQLDNVRKRSNDTNTQNDELRAEVSRWRSFANLGDELVRGRLANNPPVLIVAVRGVETGVIDDLRQTLATAGASLQGTVWFTDKFALTKPEDAQTLGTILGETGKPDTLRHDALVALADGWAAGAGSALIGPLHDDGFVDFDAPSPAPADVTALATGKSQFIVVSDASPDVANAQVAVPFATELVQAAPDRVLAAEPGHDAAPKVPAERAVFLHDLRGNSDLTSRMSSVDDLEDYRGRMASVLALAQLPGGRTGQYGDGPGASQLLPGPSS